MNILLILLGCNISYLLNERIHTAIQFASNISTTTNGIATVNWFLSGGIKNPNEDTVTEAEKMARDIAQQQLDTRNQLELYMIQLQQILPKISLWQKIFRTKPPCNIQKSIS